MKTNMCTQICKTNANLRNFNNKESCSNNTQIFLYNFYDNFFAILKKVILITTTIYLPISDLDSRILRIIKILFAPSSKYLMTFYRLFRPNNYVRYVSLIIRDCCNNYLSYRINFKWHTYSAHMCVLVAFKKSCQWWIYGCRKQIVPYDILHTRSRPCTTALLDFFHRYHCLCSTFTGCFGTYSWTTFTTNYKMYMTCSSVSVFFLL